MDLKKLAVALGLSKDSAQEIVFETLAKRESERTTALESLKALTGELGTYGLKLDGGRLVKLSGVEAEGLELAINDADDERTKKLKSTLAEKMKTDRISQLSANRETVDRLVKEGRVPPTVATALTRLLGLREKAEAFALSTDGKDVVQTVENARELLVTVLSNLPRMTMPAAGLSQHRPADVQAEAGSAEEATALARKGAAIAQRIRGKKADKKDAKKAVTA